MFTFIFISNCYDYIPFRKKESYEICCSLGKIGPMGFMIISCNRYKILALCISNYKLCSINTISISISNLNIYAVYLSLPPSQNCSNCVQIYLGADNKKTRSCCNWPVVRTQPLLIVPASHLMSSSLQSLVLFVHQTTWLSSSPHSFSRSFV